MDVFRHCQKQGFCTLKQLSLYVYFHYMFHQLQQGAEPQWHRNLVFPTPPTEASFEHEKDAAMGTRARKAK